MNDFATGYAIGQNDGRGNSNCGFGDMGGGWLWIIVLFALMFGGFGFGGLGGFGGFGGGAGLQGMATRADITAGFQFQELQAAVRGIERGISDATYALNNTVVNGFHGVERSICDLSHQMSDCCCENRAAIADLKYTIATEDCATRNLIQNTTRDLIDNQNNNTRSILDFLVKDKIDTLTAENQALKFAASQSRQNDFLSAVADSKTAELIRRLGADCPTPAYVVQPPTPVNFPTNGCGTFTGWGGNCGCACG